MHFYASLHELNLDQAAKLIACGDNDPIVIRDCRNDLEQAIKRGDLRAHDKDVEMAFIAGEEPLIFKVPHVWREDLQRYCAERGITAAYAGLPELTKEEQRLADLERVCAEQSDATIRDWKKRHVLAALRPRPLFAERTDSTLESFWKDAGRARFQAIQARRGLKKKR